MGGAILTQQTDLRKFYTANDDSTTFAGNAATTTEPSADGTTGVIDLMQSDNLANLIFWGRTDGLTADAQVWLWYKVATLWIPRLAATLNLTCGSSTGVSGATITNDDDFVDTIVLSSGDSDVTVNSQADNEVACVIVDCKGAKKIEVNFDRTGATEVNGAIVGY